MSLKPKTQTKSEPKQTQQQEHDSRLVARNLAKKIIEIRARVAEGEEQIKTLRAELEAVTGYGPDVPQELAQAMTFPGVGTIARTYVKPRQVLSEPKLVENLTRVLGSGEKATKLIDMSSTEKAGYSYLDVRAEKAQGVGK